MSHKDELLEVHLGSLERRLEHLEREFHILYSLFRTMLGIETHFLAVHFTGESMANSLTLNVGQTSTASITPLLVDGVTPSGGALSDVSYTFSDSSATVVLNPDGLTALVTGVAGSSGPISGSVACTVTDTDGVVSRWTQAFTITTVVPPPPEQLTQSVAVEFSVPA